RFIWEHDLKTVLRNVEALPRTPAVVPRLPQTTCPNCAGMLRRSSVAVATSREGERQPRSGPEAQPRRSGRSNHYHACEIPPVHFVLLSLPYCAGSCLPSPRRPLNRPFCDGHHIGRPKQGLGI